MKIRISATIEKETDKALDRFLEKGKYRNKSHVIEEAVKELIEKEGKNDKSKK